MNCNLYLVQPILTPCQQGAWQILVWGLNHWKSKELQTFLEVHTQLFLRAKFNSSCFSDVGNLQTNLLHQVYTSQITWNLWIRNSSLWYLKQGMRIKWGKWDKITRKKIILATALLVNSLLINLLDSSCFTSSLQFMWILVLVCIFFHIWFFF